MRKLWALLPGLCLALISLNAKADPTLTFNSVPGGGDIGPYSMTLNSTTNLLLFCMNDTDFIESNESWGVNIVNGANLASFFSGTDPAMGTEYEEEAYIYSQYNGTNATDVQNALWDIFDPKPAGTLDTAAQTFVTDAEMSSNPFYTNGSLAGYNFYLYDGNAAGIQNRYDGYDPQNFIGAAPEPSSLLLLGSGLIGLAGAARRKLRRA